VDAESDRNIADENLGRPLKIVVFGASGAIGRAVTRRLTGDGHYVSAVVRSASSHVDGDAAISVAAEDDVPRLPPEFHGTVDTIINCIGLFQSSAGDTVDVNVRSVERAITAARLWKARRIVHLSAAGAGEDARSSFSATKQEAEERLVASGLDYVILRPSVVIGRHFTGSSALFLGLAALPLRVELAGTGPIDAVALSDVTDVIARVSNPRVAGHMIVDVAGPQRFTTGSLAMALRQWLGLPPPRRCISMPRWLAGAGFALGDVANTLGWRSPLTQNGKLEMVRGAPGDPGQTLSLLGRPPRAVAGSLGQATRSDLWFARLYLLRPLLVGVFAAFWIVTGLIALGPGWEIALNVLRSGGVTTAAPLLVLGGAAVDLVVGAMILWRRSHVWGLWAAIGVSMIYVVSGTLIVPELWADPLGPMLKIWPIIAFNLALLALADGK
jgi:uncharacterized protein YbjT (DUF2867 family)